MPVRVLDLVKQHLDVDTACIFLEDPELRDLSLFAGSSDASSEGPKAANDAFPVGSSYRFLIQGPSVSGKTLSVLQSSLGARFDSSRPLALSRSCPVPSSLQDIARAASHRFLDSQATFATLSCLEVETYLRRLILDFPLIRPECLQKDILRLLASFFDPAGGLFLSDHGLIIGLSCSSTPTDTELLQIQINKSFLRFFTASVESGIVLRKSLLLDTPKAKPMEDFLLKLGNGED